MKYLFTAFILFHVLGISAQNFPAMSLAERDKMTQVQEGFAILNTSTGCLNYFYNEKWREVCGTCTPSIPVIDKKEFSSSRLGIQFKNAAPDVSYKGYTQPATTEIRGIAGGLEITQLNNHTFYTVHLYAENECGKSAMLTDTFTVNFQDACEGKVAWIDKKTMQKYAIAAIGNQCWLGADVQAKAEKSPGLYIDKNTNSYFSWTYANKTNIAICPEGWHIPNLQEAEALVQYLGKQTDNTFFKANGAYDFTDKTLKVPENMYIWTSFAKEKEHYLLMISHQQAMIVPTTDDIGAAIRCIKNAE